MRWQDRAACDPSTSEFFDDERDEGETPYERGRRHGRAIAICLTCPVKVACYGDSLPGDGIRGGQLVV